MSPRRLRTYYHRLMDSWQYLPTSRSSDVIQNPCPAAVWHRKPRKCQSDSDPDGAVRLVLVTSLILTSRCSNAVVRLVSMSTCVCNFLCLLQAIVARVYTQIVSLFTHKKSSVLHNVTPLLVRIAVSNRDVTRSVVSDIRKRLLTSHSLQRYVYYLRSQ